MAKKSTKKIVKKPTDRKTVAKPSPLSLTYGIGSCTYLDLAQRLISDGGEVLIKIVRRSKTSGPMQLAYGLFYKAENGLIFDVQQGDKQLKTFTSADRVLDAMQLFSAELDDEITGVYMPLLIEANVVEPGQLR